MKKKIKGTSKRPRLYVFKSNKHLYIQIIDDTQNTILASTSTISKELTSIYSHKLYANCQTAQLLGKTIAIKSKNKGFQKLVFDRGQNIYHGQIREIANAARQEGIIF